MKKLLLVEDDKDIVLGLTFLLQKNYDVTVAYSKKQALEALQVPFDFVILDIMLGDGNGFEIAKTIPDTPILFLTARDDEQSIVTGLSLGEDYLTKPFRNQELLARIQKIMARHQPQWLHCGKASLDLQRKCLLVEGNAVAITSQEYKVLELLFGHKNQVITRERILAVIWDSNENYVNDNTLTVTIKRIRKKLSGNYIKTVKGFGYTVNEDE